MKRFFFLVLSLALAGTARAQVPAASAEVKLSPGMVLSAAQINALLDEKADLEKALRKERQEVQKKMKDASEEERAKLFRGMVTAQKERRQRLREISAVTFEETRRRQEEVRRKNKADAAKGSGS
jgi:Skp family chaperone for outer membrane proteins